MQCKLLSLGLYYLEEACRQHLRLTGPTCLQVRAFGTNSEEGRAEKGLTLCYIELMESLLES